MPKIKVILWAIFLFFEPCKVLLVISSQCLVLNILMVIKSTDSSPNLIYFYKFMVLFWANFFSLNVSRRLVAMCGAGACKSFIVVFGQTYALFEHFKTFWTFQNFLNISKLLFAMCRAVAAVWTACKSGSGLTRSSPNPHHKWVSVSSESRDTQSLDLPAQLISHRVKKFISYLLMH